MSGQKHRVHILTDVWSEILCDSATFPANGLSYSRVCGRVNAYQKGIPGAFRSSITGHRAGLENTYMEGVSITHGNAGSRQHIWSFVAAGYETANNFDSRIVCQCTNTDRRAGHTKSLHLSAKTISVKLVILGLFQEQEIYILTIPFGMVRGVVLPVPAAGSTTPHGSAQLCPKQPLLILNFVFVMIRQRHMKILSLPWWIYTSCETELV